MARSFATLYDLAGEQTLRAAVLVAGWLSAEIAARLHARAWQNRNRAQKRRSSHYYPVSPLLLPDCCALSFHQQRHATITRSSTSPQLPLSTTAKQILHLLLLFRAPRRLGHASRCRMHPSLHVRPAPIDVALALAAAKGLGHATFFCFLPPSHSFHSSSSIHASLSVAAIALLSLQSQSENTQFPVLESR